MGAREEAVAVPAAASPADPATLYALPATWAKWVENLLATNRLPLSGDVTQWIRTWGEAVSQVGLVNYNIAGSGNPQLEKRIGSRFSYGRQLGRILAVLEPLVQANEALLRERAEPEALAEFREMVEGIRALKRRTPDDIVQEVETWLGTEGAQQRLAELLHKLEALAAKAPRGTRERGG